MIWLKITIWLKIRKTDTCSQGYSYIVDDVGKLFVTGMLAMLLTCTKVSKLSLHVLYVFGLHK